MNDGMKHANRLWWMGNILAFVLFVALGLKYGITEGFVALAFYGVLTDIRHSLMLIALGSKK